jgi:uncharacterized membrane protein
LVVAASAEAVGLAWVVSAVVPTFRAVVISNELLARTKPGLLDLLIAVAAGAAGAYVTVRRRAVSALPGAAIAVALVPPLAAAGVLLNLGKDHDAAGALLLFSTNLAGIALSAAVVFLLAGFVPEGLARRHGHRIRLGLVTTVLAVAAVAYPLERESSAVLARANDDKTVSEAISAWLPAATQLSVVSALVEEAHGRETVTVDLVGPNPPPPSRTLADQLAHRLHRSVDLTVQWTERREETAASTG